MQEYLTQLNTKHDFWRVFKVEGENIVSRKMICVDCDLPLDLPQHLHVVRRYVTE